MDSRTDWLKEKKTLFYLRELILNLSSQRKKKQVEPKLIFFRCSPCLTREKAKLKEEVVARRQRKLLSRHARQKFLEEATLREAELLQELDRFFPGTPWNLLLTLDGCMLIVNVYVMLLCQREDSWSRKGNRETTCAGAWARKNQGVAAQPWPREGKANTGKKDDRSLFVIPCLYDGFD